MFETLYTYTVLYCFIFSLTDSNFLHKEPVLRIRITLMLIWIRIPLFTLMRIRIRLFTSTRLPIRLFLWWGPGSGFSLWCRSGYGFCSSLKWCESATTGLHSTDPWQLHFEPHWEWASTALHCSILSPRRPWILIADAYPDPAFYSDADPDQAFSSDTDQDPAAQNDANPCGSGSMRIRIRNTEQHSVGERWDWHRLAPRELAVRYFN